MENVSVADPAIDIDPEKFISYYLDLIKVPDQAGRKGLDPTRIMVVDS